MSCHFLGAKFTVEIKKKIPKRFKFSKNYQIYILLLKVRKAHILHLNGPITFRYLYVDKTTYKVSHRSGFVSCKVYFCTLLKWSTNNT